MTMQETFDSFMMSRRLAGLSSKTLTDYTMFVLPFICSVGSERSFEDLCQDDVNTYIDFVLKRPVSKSSRATYIRHLKVYLRWCEDTYGAGYRAKLIKVPKSPKKSVRIYSDEEIVQIFRAVGSDDTDWITLRNKCIIALMYDSGLRQSEVCTLRRSEISFDENRMTVYGKGNKERIVPLGMLTKCFMADYFSACPYSHYSGAVVFVNRHGHSLTCNAVKLFVSKLADRLPFDLSSHKLRHNFATNYCIDQYEKYGQIDIYRLMYLMGHEDVETTRRYLHLAYELIACKNSVSHLDKVPDLICRQNN